MVKKKTKWLLPTNTENLKMIIAQGLISSSDGFTKYYSDVLELVPNYIPLFKDEIPSTLLNHVLSEDNSLIPVILDIDLKKISNGIKILQDDKLVNLEGEVDSTDILFILAPLPLSSIATLMFSSKDVIKEFQEDSKLYSNVVLNDLKLSSTVAEQKLFKSNTLSIDWVNDLRKIDTMDIDEIDYKKVYAYGGLLLNLFYFAKNGNLSNDNYKLFSNFSEEKKSQDIDIYDYFKAFDINNADIKKKMDIGLIDIAINSKDFKEDVLKFLEYGNWDERTQKRTQELADKLKGFELNTNKTVSEQFYEAKTPLEKILLMLFLREDTEALMAYTLELFREEDYINFAMMFGIRDKFIKMPKELREFAGLQSFISLKMAEYAHYIIGSDMKFKSLTHPLTIMDMLENDRFKEYFAKELKMESCFQTIIPKSDYIVVKGKPVFTGIIIPEFELLEENYFELISKYKLTEYNDFLKKYEKFK